MADFKKHSRFSGSSKRPFDRNDRSNGASRDLHDALCSKCAARCQVPFRPNGKKPVYCQNCFTKDRQHGSSAYPPKREFTPRRMEQAPAPAVPDRQIQDLKRQIEAMNATLERLAEAIDSLSHTIVLNREVRKHIPTDEPKNASAKASAKKSTKRAVTASKKKS